MKKIRILEVVGSLRVGGQERIAASISEYIDKNKFQVDYLVWDDIESINTETVEKNGGRIIRVNNIYSSRFCVVARLKKVMIENGPYDIVHSHGMYNNGYVVKAAKLAGVKCRISHSHSTNDGKQYSGVVYKLYKILMRKYMLNYSTAIVACGQEAGKYLFGSKDFEKNGIVFYNRVDTNKFEYSIEKHNHYRNKLGFGDDRVFIIVGHIIPLKNHKFAIEAFEKHNRINEKSKLVVLGDGDSKDELIASVKAKQLSDAIDFCGNVSNVNEYMLAADCLLMPSWFEGLPLTLIEAQAASLPCIVSDTITKEVNISNMICWRSINDIDAWVEAMNMEWKRTNIKQQIIDQNYSYDNYSEWLTLFYNGLYKSNAK